MKEIIPGTEADKVVIVGQAEQIKHQKPKYVIKQKKGHILWELNLDTGDCIPAEFEEITLELDGLKPNNIHQQLFEKGAGNVTDHKTIKKKLIDRGEGFMYISALNKKSLGKKLEKVKNKFLTQ